MRNSTGQPSRRVLSGLLMTAMVPGLLSLSCGGGSSPTEPLVQKTMAHVSIDAVACKGLTLYPVLGSLTATSFTYKTGVISVSPTNAVDVELPQGGAYRAFFYYGPVFNPIAYWDFSVNVTSMQTTQVAMTCNGATGAQPAPR